MRRRTLLAALAIAATATLTTTSFAVAPPAQATGKVKCGDPVGIVTADPIKAHNLTGSAAAAAMIHQHQMFGNPTLAKGGNATSYADMKAGGAGPCRLSADTAGYWTPTLVYISGAKKGQIVPTNQFTAYYRPYTGAGGPSFGEGAPWPQDTRLIAKSATSLGGGWSCGQNSGARAKRSDAIPDCTGLSGKPGYTLTSHTMFPSCWNGKAPNHRDATDRGDTQDSANYAYPTKVKGQTLKQCPAGFPNKMVTLTETIQFAYVGNGSDVALSSDLMAGKKDGSTMHADFWNTWDKPGLDQFVRNCVTSASGYTQAECDK